MTSPRAPSAEQIFAEFLDRLEAGEHVDFAALCAQHPERAESLRRVHTRWQAMARAFTELSRSAPGAPAIPCKSLDDMKTRLASRGGRLARYVLGREIARGAMGRIVSAWDDELRREVALKIHRGSLADTRMQRRFLDEAQIAAQLDHPGIVPVHEVGLDADGRPFFAMQLVRGRDLGEIIAAVPTGDGGWSRTRVLHVLLRVCEAMAFAHEKGVMHRDLKPANIMVGRFGETYVMDWGLAHVRGSASEPLDTLRDTIAKEDAGSALLTRQGDVIGTPAYMAPEQADGRADASPQADVYSVGAILYHLCAGDVPYAGAVGGDAVLAALRAGPPAPLRDDVPAELRAICERAMARDLGRRYAGMSELAEDLRAFLEVRTVSAYATGRFAELRKWVARNKALAVVLGAFAVALVVGAASVTWLWVRAESNRERADANATRLLAELDRSGFRSARQELQLENSSEARDVLWRAHFAGRMPRATAWALRELAVRDPYLVTLPVHVYGLPVACSRIADVVLFGGRDGRLQLRDPDTLALRSEVGEPGSVITALAALDAAPFAVAGNDAGEVLVFDLAAQRLVRRSTPHTGRVRCVVGVGDGVATGGNDGSVLRWTRLDGEPVTVATVESRVSALAVRPNGDGLIWGDDRGVVGGRAFNGSWAFSRAAMTGQVTALAFGDRPEEFWIGGTDHALHFWNTIDKTRERTIQTRNGTCRQLVRDADGSLLAGGWWRTDRLRADGTLTPVALRDISRIALDEKRHRLVTSGEVSGIGLVDLDRGDRRLLADAAGAVLSYDGRRVACRERGEIVVRDVDGNAVVGRGPGREVSWFRLDGDGGHIACANADASLVRVIDVATGAQISSYAGTKTGSVRRPTLFSPDGSELAVCVESNRVVRVRASDGAVLGDWTLPGGDVYQAAYSPDGCWHATIRRGDSIVRMVHVTTGERRDVAFSPLRPSGVPADLSALALSFDGSAVAAGTWQGTILVRRPDGTTTTLPGHAGTVWSLQFAERDSELLYSSGGAKGVSCWDLASNECCFQGVYDLAVGMQVSRDGNTLLCSVPGGAMLLDLTYHERHIAGNLRHQLERLRGQATIAPARERELLAWADEVLARPWPRWR